MVFPLSQGTLTPAISGTQTPITMKNKNNNSTKSLTNDASRKSILKNHNS